MTGMWSKSIKKAFFLSSRLKWMRLAKLMTMTTLTLHLAHRHEWSHKCVYFPKCWTWSTFRNVAFLWFSLCSRGHSIMLISPRQHWSKCYKQQVILGPDKCKTKVEFNTGANRDSMQLTANSVLQGERPKSLSSTPVWGKIKCSVQQLWSCQLSSFSH